MRLPHPTVRFWKRLHGILTIFWAAMMPVSILTGLKTSLPYIVMLSVYALMVGHFSAWQGTRAEDKSADNGQD